MAKAVIDNISNGQVRRIATSDYSRSKIIYRPGRAVITDTIPFRVKFTNIGIPGYGPGNVPPIGIAIIGFNNYIL